MAKTSRTPRASGARARLLLAADDLFASKGIAATPVDEAVGHAGVAVMTLYRHFGGKDELVAAYLRERHERWMQRWQRHLDAATDPTGRVLSLFDALDEWASEGGAGGGCAFVDAAAELRDRDHPAWREIEAHKHGVRRQLADLAASLYGRDADGLADQLILVYEGALSALLIGHVARPIDQARALARGLLTSPETTCR